VQTPFWQVARLAFGSEQPVPFALIGLEQTPVPESQEPTS
jgi:hypothetical protein